MPRATGEGRFFSVPVGGLRVGDAEPILTFSPGAAHGARCLLFRGETAVNAAINQARSAEDYAAGKALIEEYAAALGVDLCFQNFSEEIASLSSLYGPPGGRLLLARVGGEPAGCVAVRDRGAPACEMKRLYVRPPYRGLGLGRRLAESAIGSARELGYSRMVLDTLPSMSEAQALYESLGFREAEAYYANPLLGVRYLARSLADTAT